MRPVALIALLAALAPRASAQRATLPVAHQRPSRSSAIFFADPFYSDALNREGSFAASPPPVIILQAAPAPAPVATPPAPPAQPLMIELQAGRYVRVSGDATSTAEIEMKQVDPPSTYRAPFARHPEKINVDEPASATAHDPAPAVLIFRDGRRQEVSEYTIADGILYTHADYYTSGSWNQQIELSTLNLSETITTNQARGIKFRLPTAPNEVIVSP